MTPSLDLSDFLIPLIFIGVAIYQVITRARQKPGAEDQERSPFPDDFDPGPGERRDEDQTWDELMEALGQKPEQMKEAPGLPPPPSAPVAPAPPVVMPPPLPRRIEVSTPMPASQVSPAVPARTVAAEPAREAGGGFWGGPDDPSAWSRTPFRQTDGSARAFAAQAVRFREVPAFDAVHLRRVLHQPDRVREAILLNEVLQKPVALRGPMMGWSG